MDGDIIEVEGKSQLIEVRLWGIDCPEKNQPWGKRARQFTTDNAFGKTVLIDPIAEDHYGCIKGVVILPDGERVLNIELIKAGLAWWDKLHAPEADAYRKLEMAARSEKRGLWSDSNPKPPWEWRKDEGHD